MRGWGFQLQSPVFIAVLASFMFFFALSLAGQFDIGLGLTSVGGALAQKRRLRGKFLYWRAGKSGGYSVHSSADGRGDRVHAGADGGRQVCGVHGAGAGPGRSVCRRMSWHPVWARVLPKPGAWMEVLKQFTSLFLFGTAIWLAWVYGQLYGAGRGREPGGAAAGLLQAAGNCGMGTGAVAGEVG